MKKVAVVQSNYIPWKGYFDLIAAVDEFILYDDAQYTKRDWRNRNLIKTQQGLLWLTVPVKVKGKFFQKIQDTQLNDDDWRTIHWKTLCHTYKGAKYFTEIAELLEPLYLGRSHTHLSSLNCCFIQGICDYLDINTRIRPSSDYSPVNTTPNEKLIDLCVKAEATVYISGPAAKSYLDNALFESHQMSLEWFEYNSYPEYPQLWGSFEHKVSIIDLLFNCGPNAPAFMKYSSNAPAGQS